MAYHYTDSGLDNVYLENGYTVHQTAYGEGVSIHDTENLHRAISRWLIRSPEPLTGAELRFLRLELELTQNDLGGIMGEPEQKIQRWERDRKRPLAGAADRFMRALTNEYLEGDGSLRRMVDRLAELDRHAMRPCASFEFEVGQNAWRLDQAA